MPGPGVELIGEEEIAEVMHEAAARRCAERFCEVAAPYLAG